MDTYTCRLMRLVKGSLLSLAKLLMFSPIHLMLSASRLHNIGHKINKLLTSGDHESVNYSLLHCADRILLLRIGYALCPKKSISGKCCSNSKDRFNQDQCLVIRAHLLRWNLDLRRYLVSRPGEFHPQPLAERCVSLSTHTAPIKQTRQPSPFSSERIDTAAFSQYFP